ncbi:MAG: enoyl-CoA hydratase-related protein [Pseudomonadota bacterium]
MSEEQSVLFEKADGVATITLNRPSALNAMTNGLMRGISQAMDRVREDKSIRVVVLTGAGRGFCAGADLSQVAEGTPSSNTEDNDDTFNAALNSIHNSPVPTIARVNGAAAGGGFGLALACDITIAAHSAFFVATFGPKLGIVPDMGATWNIPLRAGRARALGITLLGERIPAVQAEAWGLIWAAVPDDQLDTEVARISDVLKHSSPSTSTRIRATIDAASHNTFGEQLDLEMVHQAVLIPRNMQEGARAFMQKRDAEFGPERD